MNKTRTYTVVGIDGVKTVHEIQGKASLEQLQAWVGGYIQMLQILPKYWIVVNEEGAINGMQVNPAMRWQGQPLHGPIVLLPKGCTS